MKRNFLKRVVYGVGGLIVIAVALLIVWLLKGAADAVLAFLKQGGFNLFSAVTTLVGVAVFWIFSTIVETVCNRIRKKTTKPSKKRSRKIEDEDDLEEELALAD